MGMMYWCGFCSLAWFNFDCWFLTGCTCWISSGYASIIGTLGDSTWSGVLTLFGVYFMIGRCCCCDWSFTILVGITLGVDLLNIRASVLSAAVWVSPSVPNGISGAVLFKEWIKSYDIWVAALVEDIVGVVNFLGNKSTVSGIFLSFF